MINKYIPLTFVLIFNLWIYQILSVNLFVGVCVVFASISLWKMFQTNKNFYFQLSLVFFILLLFFQYKTSDVSPLTFLNENEKLEQQVKLRAYSGKIFILPMANWLELRNETVAFYRIENNVAEVLDPNLYFFANHPRERIGVIEKEKFPYILLPALLLGLFSLRKKDARLLLLGISPLVLISGIGNSNPMGPFSLFPFLAVMIAVGVEKIIAQKKLRTFAIVIFLLVFIQAVAYTKY